MTGVQTCALPICIADFSLYAGYVRAKGVIPETCEGMANLERWAAGLFEGMEVQSGDLLGYVGNTGNAKTTPPHLHFAVNDNDEMVNPYPILTRASVVQRARVTHESGNALGTR